MRRHFIAATFLGLALAAPGAARAQAVGEVTTAAGEDIYLNATECDQAQAEPLELRWWVTVPGGAVTGGTYKVFASSTAPVATGSGPRLCETEDVPADSVFAGQVGADIDAFASDASRSEDFNAWEFPAAAGKACTVDSDRTIYVCVHFYPSSDPSTATGSATGTLILSTGLPATPTGLSVKPGDTRLHAAWHKGSGGTTTKEYVAVATPSAEVGLPDGSRPGERTATTTDTSATVGSLVNGTEYQVVVYALTQSGTSSDASVPAIGTPQPVKDFWELYQDGAGPETGGCGGPAGPLALLGLAGALFLGGRAAAGGARRKP